MVSENTRDEITFVEAYKVVKNKTSHTLSFHTRSPSQVYKSFMEILHTFQKDQKTVKESSSSLNSTGETEVLLPFLKSAFSSAALFHILCILIRFI